MERDALLSHGAAFLLHDRLMNCSDRHVAHVCSTCGSLLSPSARREVVATAGQSAADAATSMEDGGGGSGYVAVRCITCNPVSGGVKNGTQGPGKIVKVAMPYVFRYLANELAAMGIKLTLKTS